MGYEIGTLRIYKGGVSVYVLAVSNLLQEVLSKIVFEYVEHCRRQYFPENELVCKAITLSEYGIEYKSAKMLTFQLIFRAYNLVDNKIIFEP
jgi:hypothetical protein